MKITQKVLYITVYPPCILQVYDISSDVMGSFLCTRRCNILEEPIESTVEYADYIPLELNPFEVASFILYLKKNT